MKVFCVTVRAIDDRISQTHHYRAPVALPYAPVLWISYSFSESFGEQVTQKTRIDSPERERVAMILRIGCVCVVVRIEDEQRLCSVKLFHRWQVQTLDR